MQSICLKQSSGLNPLRKILVRRRYLKLLSVVSHDLCKNSWIEIRKSLVAGLFSYVTKLSKTQRHTQGITSKNLDLEGSGSESRKLNAIERQLVKKLEGFSKTREMN